MFTYPGLNVHPLTVWR